METGEGLPDPADVLHETARTRVTRVFLPGRTIIRKQPLGPDAERRLRHERAMLERLRGTEGVVQLLDEPRYSGSISLTDLGGTSLAGQSTPLDVEALVGLGSALAGAMAGMHRRGVLHRDITPANVVISRDGTPCLVGFGLATSLAEIRPEFTHYTEIVGTLAYLAPEQTGRTGRSVDQRADLYALGATLYELATGAPPFGSGDPLRLTHDHLARVPVPPAEVNAAVPGRLSEIIHLLEKEPDNRYQTADGVLHDLQRLRDGHPDPAAAPVRIGRGDIPLRLLPPSQLVGRDAEVAALQEAFDDALAGRCRAVLVGGAPGVGKTALIDELRPVVTRSGGWFVAGKFDQYRRDLESSGVYRAFRTLGRLLLAEPEDELAEVRDRIRAALGPNAGLMAAVVSEYAALLAVPPDPGDPMTAQVRGSAAACGSCRRSRRRNDRSCCSSTICSGSGGPRLASSTCCWTRSRSRVCCWWRPIANTTRTARIRWPGRCPGGGSAPACGTSGWPTWPGRAWSPWLPRCCASTRPPRRAWPS
jgi:hypothetical protein